MGTSGHGVPHITGAIQTATLSQAAPTQDTWYTLLTTSSFVRVFWVQFSVATTGEDLELEMVIDGNTWVATIAAVAGTDYYIRLPYAYGTRNILSAIDSLVLLAQYSPVEFKSCRIRVRKTSNAGAGTITAFALYDQW